MDPDCNKEEKRSASLDLLLSVVEYKTPSGKLKRGFCSNYLANAKPDERVALHLKSSPSFHIESRTDGMIPPTILIGAGSGLAPFRGFWQKLNQESTSRQPSKSMWTPMLKYFVSKRKYFFHVRGRKQSNVRESKSLIQKSLRGKSMPPHWVKTFFFHSFLQLPSFDCLKGFFSW